MMTEHPPRKARLDPLHVEGTRVALVRWPEQTRKPLRVTLSLIALACASCTRVDYAPEMQQANQAVQSVTGMDPKWCTDMPVREFRPEPGETLTLDRALELALASN